MTPPTLPDVLSCKKGPTPDIEPVPIGTLAEWIKEGPAWAAKALGTITEERRLRAEEHRCLDDHAAAGEIR